MNKVEIGNAAGEVWRLLDGEGDLSITNIQKKLKMSEQLLYLAIGWLCRENKIHCFEEKGKYICSKNVPGSFFG
jgi:hypothetical protein